ncbi:protein adenylyltransferase SelO [Ornithinimicrobium sp. W1679]|uniref:protein adenylyltransferase SelO n=1 Tax=Ornithinimicrobium sp. W1679 TaxID=3418770 RepID=UPI003CF62822
MSTSTRPALVLGGQFAAELSELAIPWQAEAAPDPRILVLNEPLATELGLDPEWLRGAEGVGLLTGRSVPVDATPVAQAYAGHQFGAYSPRLGDGRALLLGEVLDPAGRRRDLHLKGSGRTPFARAGDGLAAVGPMLREHVVSEAMHALGIPTTRSLAVVATGRRVQRERTLPGAVLARVAGSHLRVGTFQFARATGDVALLRRLADHAIDRHHPEAAGTDDRYAALLRAVVADQASLVARWMLVGFVHGVMNTDNTTISGETIDYGPCAFLDRYDPATVYSSIDTAGRYAYGNQPAVARWNLARLAEAMLPLLHEEQDRAVELAVEAVDAFVPAYGASWTSGMRAKLGLPEQVASGDVGSLAEELLGLLQEHRVDHTTFFRSLGAVARGDTGAARRAGADEAAFDAWFGRWLPLRPDAASMDLVNPVHIPRNHLVEEALDAAVEGDLTLVHRLLEAVTDPYVERPHLERYAAPAPSDLGPYRTFCGT